jgi:probable phosphoglycerate mutase
MNGTLPTLWLAWHGETAWSLSGQHTGLTDLPLTERGERNARQLGERLRKVKVAKVFTSPLQRAARTCELAGLLGCLAVLPTTRRPASPERDVSGGLPLLGK